MAISAPWKPQSSHRNCRITINSTKVLAKECSITGNSPIKPLIPFSGPKKTGRCLIQNKSTTSLSNIKSVDTHSTFHKYECPKVRTSEPFCARPIFLNSSIFLSSYPNSSCLVHPCLICRSDAISWIDIWFEDYPAGWFCRWKIKARWAILDEWF